MASTDRYITLTSDFYWERRATPEESAKAAQKRSAPRKPSAWLTYEMPEGAVDAYVDQMGNMAWSWAEGADTNGAPTLVSEFTKA